MESPRESITYTMHVFLFFLFFFFVLLTITKTRVSTVKSSFPFSCCEFPIERFHESWMEPDQSMVDMCVHACLELLVFILQSSKLGRERG